MTISQYKRNIKCIVQYDGTNFKGWQIQKRGNTIQGVVSDVIRRITGEDVVIVSSGRTDTGVHALGQVIAFKTYYSSTVEVLKKGINALLPPSIRVIDICDVSLDFHPRYDARAKTYAYLVCCNETVSPFLHPYCWHVRKDLDITKIKDATSYLLGKKDFSGFMASGSSVKNTVRNMMKFEVSDLDTLVFLNFILSGRFLRFECKADGFLRHMVRNIVGTLVEIGAGRFPVEHVQNILKSRDRRLAGVTAPAKGLFLYGVEY